MSGCNCNQVPNYSVVGFGGQRQQVTAAGGREPISVAALGRQLSAEGITALGLSACAKASVSNGNVCFSFPIIGDICFPVPLPLPSGNLKVCGDLCTDWAIPTGLKVTLYANDNPVWSGVVWGSC